MADKPIAEKAATWERPADLDGRDQDMPAAPPEPERADEDLVIAREDLGPDAGTLIAKGDPIPPDLAGLPRRPVRATRKK